MGTRLRHHVSTTCLVEMSGPRPSEYRPLWLSSRHSRAPHRGVAGRQLTRVITWLERYLAAISPARTSPLPRSRLPKFRLRPSGPTRQRDAGVGHVQVRAGFGRPKWVTYPRCRVKFEVRTDGSVPLSRWVCKISTIRSGVSSVLGWPDKSKGSLGRLPGTHAAQPSGHRHGLVFHGRYRPSLKS